MLLANAAEVKLIKYYSNEICGASNTEVIKNIPEMRNQVLCSFVAWDIILYWSFIFLIKNVVTKLQS